MTAPDPLVINIGPAETDEEMVLRATTVQFGPRPWCIAYGTVGVDATTREGQVAEAAANIIRRAAEATTDLLNAVSRNGQAVTPEQVYQEWAMQEWEIGRLSQEFRAKLRAERDRRSAA